MYEEIVSFPFEAGGSLVELLLAGVSHCDKTYRIVREKSEFYVFEYIKKGRGTLLTRDGVCEPRAGDVYLLKPGRRHDYSSDGADPWEKVWFNVRGELLDLLVRAYRLEEIDHFPSAGGDAELLFDRLYTLCTQGVPYSELCSRAALCLHELLALLSRQATRSAGALTEGTRIRNLLDASLEKKTTLRELSNALYLSPSQIIRSFKREFGVTPYRYLLDRRLDAAKLLLLSSQMSAKQIAYQLKFADEHYFSTAFKEAVGLSPRAFRLSGRQKPRSGERP